MRIASLLNNATTKTFRALDVIIDFTVVACGGHLALEILCVRQFHVVFYRNTMKDISPKLFVRVLIDSGFDLLVIEIVDKCFAEAHPTFISEITGLNGYIISPFTGKDLTEVLMIVLENEIVQLRRPMLDEEEIRDNIEDIALNLPTISLN